MSLEIGKVTNRVLEEMAPEQNMRANGSRMENRLGMSQTELTEFLRPILRTLLDEELRRFQRSCG